MKRCIMILVGIILVAIKCVPVYTQDQQAYAPKDFSIIPPSPEVSSMLKYNEIPVDYLSGLPNISFELFRLSEGGVTVPIVLSYHGGGIKTDETEGNAGFGWEVSMGANISRTVVGGPDESHGSRTHISGLLNLDNDEKRFRRNLMQKDANYDPTNGMSYKERLSWIATSGQRYGEGLTDVANDIFHISGFGLSGTFIYNDEGKMVLSTESQIDIEPKSVHGFYPDEYTVNDNKGISYTFGNTENTRYTYYHGDPQSNQTEDSIKYISAWHISSVKDACGNKVDFIYDEIQGCEWKDNIYEAISDVNDFELRQYVPKQAYAVNTVVYYPCVLKEIRSRGINVKIEYNTLTKGLYRKMLVKSIKVYTKGDSLRKEFSFIYSDQCNPTTNTSDSFWRKRQVLSRIDENGTEIYRFDYNENKTSNINYNIASSDFGGYYNGISNASLVPSYSGYEGGMSNRSVVPSAAITNSLKSISYPTGGSTAIEWESNEYGNVQGIPIKKSINDRVGSITVDTIRMCIDNVYKKLKVTDFMVRNNHEIKLDLTKYFLMNPANLMTTEYEDTHYSDNFANLGSIDYPYISIKDLNSNKLVGVYFLDKETIEKRYHNEPIPLSLANGTYEFELHNPTSVRGAEESLESNFLTEYSIAGKIYVIRNIYTTDNGDDAVKKDYWSGLRVRRIVTKADETSNPIIKEYLYGCLDPDTSDGTVSMLPQYNNSYYKVVPYYNVPGEKDVEIVTIASEAFPSTPLGSMGNIQYPKVMVRLTEQERYNPNGYLNDFVEYYNYSSWDSNNIDYNNTDFLSFQPVGSRMYTSLSHKRGNLISKREGPLWGENETTYRYNIYEPETLDTFTTGAFTICDFSDYPGINGHYGSNDYSIGKYSLIPYNKTIAGEASFSLGKPCNSPRIGDTMCRNALSPKSVMSDTTGYIIDLSQSQVVKDYKVEYLSPSKNDTITSMVMSTMGKNIYQLRESKCGFDISTETKPGQFMHYSDCLPELPLGNDTILYYEATGRHGTLIKVLSKGYARTLHKTGLSMVTLEADTIRDIVCSDISMEGELCFEYGDSITRYRHSGLRRQWYAHGYRYPVLEMSTHTIYDAGVAVDSNTQWTYLSADSQSEQIEDDIENEEIRQSTRQRRVNLCKARSLSIKDNGDNSNKKDTEYIRDSSNSASAEGNGTYGINAYVNWNNSDKTANVTVTTDKGENVQLALTNSAGAILDKRQTYISGQEIFEFSLVGYPSGVYMISVLSDSKTFTFKLMNR